HEETERRRKAAESSVAPIPAVRARGARELGLLGRDEDRKRLLQLLGDRDGVVVAAAARALGDAGDIDAAPRLQALLGEKGEVAAAKEPKAPVLGSPLRAQGDAPGLDASLGKLLKAGETDARIPRIAERYRVAGPALVEALRREQSARAKELETKKGADDDGS